MRGKEGRTGEERREAKKQKKSGNDEGKLKCLKRKGDTQ